MFVLIIAATILLIPLAQKNISQQNNVHTNQAVQTPRSTNNASYSKDEVTKHNKANDCWTIIHDKIYLATMLLPLLQGKMATDQVCGKDISPIFDKAISNYSNFDNESALQQYYVGGVK